MLSFLTQCPHCLTSFRVTDRQLDAAEGLVRCGACLGIFSAEANRITVKPTPDEAAAAEARADFDDDEDMEVAFDDESGAPDDFDDFDDFDDAEEAAALAEYNLPAKQDDQHKEYEIDDADELDTTDEDDEPDDADEFDSTDEDDEPDDADEFDSTDEDDEPDDADELDLTDDEYDSAYSPPPADRAFGTNDADIFGPGDFDIPLGDLNLDIDDDDDANETDAEDFAESGEAGPGASSYGESEDDEPDEDDGFDELDAVEADELDDVEADARDEQPPANARLIDIVYEEYADEEDDADLAQAEDTEPSEEFEPEFSFDDDELVESRVATILTVAEITDEESEEYEDEENDEDDADDDTYFDAPPQVPPRTAATHRSADKAQLHSYLADIEDDDALDPLDDDEALDAFDEPVLLEAAPRRNRFVSLALLLASVTLMLLLVWQYADANIDRLSRSASFAPLMPYACRVLDCPAPQRVQLDLFVSEQLLVRSHPRYAQALEVSLVFRNDATQAQPFPALELGFHDTSNRMVANRLFQPAEYLPPELQTSEMPPQSSFQVTLELVDPGSDAVNYTLAFRAP